jgi:hypothetical protein
MNKITYVLFGFKTREYKTARAAFRAWKRASDAGWYFQVWKRYPDCTLVRWL